MDQPVLTTIQNFLIWGITLGLTIQAFIGLCFFVSCIWEKESRASVFGLLQFAGMLGVLTGFLFLTCCGLFKSPKGFWVLVLLFFGGIAGLALLVTRTRVNPAALQGTAGLIQTDVERFDERDQVFARNRSIRPGSEQYAAYYRVHPENEAFDTQRRAKGGPLGKMGLIDQPRGDMNVAMMLASARIPEFLSAPVMFRPDPHLALQEKLKTGKTQLSPQEATVKVKAFAKRLGADLVGITRINPLWRYTHRGEIFRENWDDWGKPLDIDRPYAIVFAEEMSLEMIGPAPHTTTTIESMYNYAKGAYISTQVAAMIANLGYSATANHFRHYEGILPPLAVDAGLGEVGRIGYLITKEFGPRIRLSAVFTDLELATDRPVDIGVMDFCRYCKKCAVCCPSRSIPMETEPGVFNGTLRWKLNEESCFDYWGKVGTDCNVCMKVCPWSHARTFPHRIIVALISRNHLARRLFTIMDDIFYGKKPRPKKAPEWAGY